MFNWLWPYLYLLLKSLALRINDSTIGITQVWFKEQLQRGGEDTKDCTLLGSYATFTG